MLLEFFKSFYNVGEANNFLYIFVIDQFSFGFRILLVV